METILHEHPTRPLAKIDWWPLFISIVDSLAKQLKCSRIGIQSSANNIWCKRIEERTGQVHLDPARASSIYDLNAVKFNFEINNDGNWYRKTIG